MSQLAVMSVCVIRDAECGLALYRSYWPVNRRKCCIENCYTIIAGIMAEIMTTGGVCRNLWWCLHVVLSTIATNVHAGNGGEKKHQISRLG